jgi:thymidylate synthase
VIEIPGTVYRTIDGKNIEFSNGKSNYTVTVTRNMTITENYYAVAKIYNVNIDLEYWDEYQNDLWFTETISGEYLEGSTILIPATVKREYNGEIRAFLLVESSTDVVIKVDGDIRRFYMYQEKT